MVDDITLEILNDMSLDLKERMYSLEMNYGTVYIAKLKDGSYELYYFKDGELIKDGN